jgi:hypothetical protein
MYGMVYHICHIWDCAYEGSICFTVAIEVEGCNFTSDLCSWSNSDRGWKLAAESSLGKGMHKELRYVLFLTEVV